MPRFIDIQEAKKPLTIEEQGGLEKTFHVFEDKDIDAINGALAARRPLLVRGEPGIGKSQLARAAAQLLGRAFVSFTVDNRTESHELMWQFDAVARLAEAQIQGVMGVTNSAEARKNLDMSHFITPGPLWWAFDWETAAKQVQYRECGCQKADTDKKDNPNPQGVAGRCLVHEPKDWKAEDGVVVLIDEIDKADASVPNGLLECLGNRSFTCCNGKQVRIKNGATPLVVVTTNEERSLPDPFLRRCVVRQLELPELPLKRDDFVKYLKKVGEAHNQADPKNPKNLPLEDDVLEKAAEMLVKDRIEILERDLSPPGCAEYLDMLTALREIRARDMGQPETMLKRLREYMFKKHPKSER